MATKINDIAHQYARVGEAFSFAIPSNIFSGTNLAIGAAVARPSKSISFDRFWLNYNAVTRTISGTPADFDDEGVLQIDVVALDIDDGSIAHAYFTICTYESGSTSTTVLPRTSAQADYVVNSGNKDSIDWSAIPAGSTIGIVGNIGNIAAGINYLNGTAAAPILITNVDGICEMDDGGGIKALTVHKSNHFKIVGQYAETDSFGRNLYGFKIKTGSSANKVLSDGSPDPSFDFGANGGGTALEIENHCFNGIEVFGVHIPYSGSAGIKVRTKLDLIDYTANSSNTTGNSTIVINESITDLLPDSGYVSIAGDNYEYTSFSGSTFNLTSTLTTTYANNAVVQSCTGIRNFHDMSGVKIHHNFVENIDTESLYMGEGFYEGRPSASNALPHDIRKVRVEWNITLNSGYEPLQVKNCVGDCKVRYNYMYNNSFRSISAQQFGLFISDGTVAEVSHNTIIGVSGSGIRFYISGPSLIHNNLVIDAGWNTGTTQRQAFYSRKNGTVITAYSMNAGGYVLTSHKSRTDLGSSDIALECDLIHNTFHQYGDGTENDDNAAIDCITDCTFRYGNNLFTDGASLVTGTTSNFTDLGGNQFTTEANASYINVTDLDFRLSNDSVAALSGVDLSGSVNSDYNFNGLGGKYHSGAFKLNSSISEDNYLYALNPAIKPKYTSFQWYASTDNIAFDPIYGRNSINETFTDTGYYYKLGVKPVSKGVGNPTGLEVLSNSILLS